MTTATQGGSGGGWFSKLLILLLLVAAVALYLLALKPGPGWYQGAPAGQASIRVIEGAAPSLAPASAQPRPVTPLGRPLQDLPEDQMALIRRVFAPETRSQ